MRRPSTRTNIKIAICSALVQVKRQNNNYAEMKTELECLPTICILSAVRKLVCGSWCVLEASFLCTPSSIWQHIITMDFGFRRPKRNFMLISWNKLHKFIKHNFGSTMCKNVLFAFRVAIIACTMTRNQPFKFQKLKNSFYEFACKYIQNLSQIVALSV